MTPWPEWVIRERLNYFATERSLNWFPVMPTWLKAFGASFHSWSASVSQRPEQVAGEILADHLRTDTLASGGLMVLPHTVGGWARKGR